MHRGSLIVGIAIGAVAAVVLGRDRLTNAHARVKDAWESPEVQGTLRRADRFVAEKAPTLHGVGEAVADSLPKTDPASAKGAS